MPGGGLHGSALLVRDRTSSSVMAGGHRSCEMPVEVLGHLEHGRPVGAAEHQPQLSVGYDLASVLRVLAAVVFDVAPELGCRFGAGMWAGSDHRGQLSRGR